MPDPSNSLPSDSLADGLETQKPSRLLWWLHPKVALPLLLLVMLLLSPFFYRVHRINRVPDFGEPFDIAAFCNVQIDPLENAANRYAVAFHGYRSGTRQPGVMEKVFESGWSEASKELQTWLDDNATPLSEWRRATEQNEAVFVFPKDQNVFIPLDRIRMLSAFSVLARLQAERCLYDGDVLEAWAWLRAAWWFNRHHTQHCDEIERSNASHQHEFSVTSIARWAADSRVDEPLLSQAIRDVHEIESVTGANAVAFQSGFLRQRVIYSSLESLVADQSRTGSRPNQQFLFLTGEPEASYRLVKMLYQHWVREADQRPHSRASAASRVLTFEDSSGSKFTMTDTEFERLLSSSQVIGGLHLSLARLDRTMQRDAARHAAMQQMLATQLYWRRHGKWPVKPEDLVPDFLSELADDPFGKSGEPLKWRREGDDLLIYSIGPNFIDDGGSKTVLTESEPLDEVVRLKPPTSALSGQGAKKEE